MEKPLRNRWCYRQVDLSCVEGEIAGDAHYVRGRYWRPIEEVSHAHLEMEKDIHWGKLVLVQ